jgi:hypothetical protein
MKGRKLKRQRAEKDLQKVGGALARALSENEEKRRARVARGIATHGTRVKDASVGREERAARGNEGWRAFLNKGWDAMAMAPHTSSPPSTHLSASSILNSAPVPTYTSTITLPSTNPTNTLQTSTSSNSVNSTNSVNPPNTTNLPNTANLPNIANLPIAVNSTNTPMNNTLNISNSGDNMPIGGGEAIEPNISELTGVLPEGKEKEKERN